MKDANKKQALHDFLVWAVTKGQANAEGLGYAPLPKELVKRELNDIERLR
jgi:ABC-type phosphate transport system substrate-binding protein